MSVACTPEPLPRKAGPADSCDARLSPSRSFGVASCRMSAARAELATGPEVIQTREEPSVAISLLDVLRRELPRKMGAYTLFDVIGRGGMAEIFLARGSSATAASRLYVVKQILPAYVQNARFAEWLVQEAKLASTLTHANIVQVYDLGRASKELFIAMEYVEGADLHALLRASTRLRQPVPLSHVTHVLAGVLRGLDYAHRRTAEDGSSLGLVHCDMSPSNVLVSLEGDVKVCDFGIARANGLIDADSGVDDDTIRGKAGYMSPEHARGEAVDARSDVFAVGILLWELLSGRRMYRAKSPDELLELARQANIPTLELGSVPDPDALQRIVNKALAVDRDQRYATAGAMLRDIEVYAAKNRLMSSPTRVGAWVESLVKMDQLAERRRRAREVGAEVNIPEVDVSTPMMGMMSPAPSYASERPQVIDDALVASLAPPAPAAATEAVVPTAPHDARSTGPNKWLLGVSACVLLVLAVAWLFAR